MSQKNTKSGLNVNHNQTLVGTSRKASSYQQVQAFGLNLNHNQTLVSTGRKASTYQQVQGFGLTLNHNQTLVRAWPDKPQER